MEFDKLLLAVIIHSKAAEQFYHYCHVTTYGASFFEDHSFFSEGYTRFQSEADKYSEYFISIFGTDSYNTGLITENVEDTINSFGKPELMTTVQKYEAVRTVESQFQYYLNELNNLSGLGLQNAIGDSYEAADVRLYKIKQKLFTK